MTGRNKKAVDRGTTSCFLYSYYTHRAQRYSLRGALIVGAFRERRGDRRGGRRRFVAVRARGRVKRRSFNTTHRNKREEEEKTGPFFPSANSLLWLTNCDGWPSLQRTRDFLRSNIVSLIRGKIPQKIKSGVIGNPGRTK